MAPPQRKRSKRVLYGVVGALVLACSGGFFYDRYAQRKDCVDPATQLVVDDDLCERDSYYRWYYGGRSKGLGSKATSGSYERGGFGRMFSGGSGG